MNITTLDENVRAWDELHTQPRFRPSYPSEPVVRFLARAFPRDSRRRVLDMGCGAGRHLLTIADFGHQPVGTDISAEGLRHARESLSHRGIAAELHEAAMDRLPFGDATIDAAIAYGVVNYGTRAVTQRALDEMRRVLASGGRALVVTRSVDDSRFGQGREIEPNTFVLDTDSTSERGMTMTFLARDDIDTMFGQFAECIVDRIDHTSEGGTIRNSDWVIEVRT